MTVYLCGGINGLSDQECRDWREVAKARLSYHGIDTLDPMRRDYRGIEDQSVDAIVEGDLDDIRACDVVLVNATRPSWGTAMEIVDAFQANRQIVAVAGDSRISPWLRFHTSAIYQYLEEALGWIVARK
jgi:hypothetical protein